MGLGNYNLVTELAQWAEWLDQGLGEAWDDPSCEL